MDRILPQPSAPPVRALRVTNSLGEEWILEIRASEPDVPALLARFAAETDQTFVTTLPYVGAIRDIECEMHFEYGPFQIIKAMPLTSSDPAPALPPPPPPPSRFPHSSSCPTCGQIAGMHEDYCAAGFQTRPGRLRTSLFGLHRIPTGLLLWLLSPLAFALGFAACSLLFFPITRHDSLGFVAAIGFALSCGCGGYLYRAVFPGDVLLGIGLLIGALIVFAVITTLSGLPFQFVWPTESTAIAWAIFAIRAAGGLVAILVGYTNADREITSAA